MLVVIDGTGDANEGVYNKEMGSSFCHQIAEHTDSPYIRGPTRLGSEVASIRDHAVNVALAINGPIRLAGYSRGGCAAILTARRLQEMGRDVDSLFLFDAVDMQVSDRQLSQVIPANVAFVAHARSARSLTFWASNPVKSRFYFYNTGRWLAGSGRLDEQAFTGTHGALGGVPWPDVSGDRVCAAKVAAWMTVKLSSRGVFVSLKA